MDANKQLTTETRAATERWFLRRGVPHLIDSYSASTGVWQRAKPFLIGVLFLQAVFAFNTHYHGFWRVLMFIGSFGLMVAAVTAYGRVRGKSLFTAQSTIDVPEALFFVFSPAAIIFLLDPRRWEPAAESVAANLVLLAATYVVLSFGLIPMVRWTFFMLGSHLRSVVSLFAKTIPLLLVLTIFMLVNAEAWQVAHLVPKPTFLVVNSMVFTVGIMFIWMSSEQIVQDVNDPQTWSDVMRNVLNTPLSGVPAPTSPLPEQEMSLGARINLRLLVVMSLTTQVVLVTALVMVFYLIMGMLLMNTDVLQLWLETVELDILQTISLGGLELSLTEEHLRVAGLVGTLAGLNVAVSALTDDSYKKTFLTDLTDEIQESLAVQRLYAEMTTEVE